MTVPCEGADEAVRVFEAITSVTPEDCVVDERFDRLIFLVPAAEVSRAIGPDGATVERVEARLETGVEVVADAPTPAEFVAEALSPATVRNVTVSENGDVVAYVEVDHEELGLAIGREGRNVHAAKRLAARRFGVDDVQFT
ncbi:MAG: NusA-like transcription termination signal-binding factor [Halanaeroarchaeum sp.]